MSQRVTQIIGVASGKGGVGKTTVSANLAVMLASFGKKVVLFDADLGLANAQLALGCRTTYNFSHVLSGEKTLNEIIVDGPLGVKLIPGASGIQHMASLNEVEAAGIIQSFSDCESFCMHRRSASCIFYVFVNCVFNVPWSTCCMLGGQ